MAAVGLAAEASNYSRQIELFGYLSCLGTSRRENNLVFDTSDDVLVLM